MEKDLLIQEKEKLYVELKNILVGLYPLRILCGFSGCFCVFHAALTLSHNLFIQYKL